MWAAIRPIMADMLHNAMPVMERLDDPTRAGMITPDDTRELIERAYAPLLAQLADMPDIQAAFVRFAEDIGRAFNDAAKSAGRLMTDSAATGETGAPAPSSSMGSPTPTPEDTPAPDAG